MFENQHDIINTFEIKPEIQDILDNMFGEQNDNIITFKDILEKVLRLPKEVLKTVYIVDLVWIKDGDQNKKGILEINIETKNNNKIDLELEISPMAFIAEKTLLKWSKMYNDLSSEFKIYNRLKNHIKLNTICFDHIPLNELHYNLRILEGINDKVLKWLKYICEKTGDAIEQLMQAVINIKSMQQVSLKNNKTIRLKKDISEVRKFVMYKNKREKIITMTGWSNQEVKYLNTLVCG